MKVYLVPAANGGHALYCEAAAPAGGPPAGARSASFRDRLIERFHRMVAEGEAVNHGTSDTVERGRLRRAITRRVAEAVAEQRLLWSLRHETSAELVHPDDIPGPQALDTSRALISEDHLKHRRWCIIDALIAAITGPVFFFVPGPNVISWYFAFRAIGHFFALRGARRGLDDVAWTTTPSGELTDLRRALTLDQELRARRIDEIAAALGLGRLKFFVKKIA